MAKIYDSSIDAIKEILTDNMTIAAGGFGLCGIPENLINAIKELGAKNLTFVSNNAGVDDFGLGILLQTKQIKKMISSYVGENKIFEQQFLNKELELELVPQGTLAEKLRAGGAGIPAFYTRTGYGTILTKDKETKVFSDKEYVLEESIVVDLAIVKGWKADKKGNVVFRYTANNFNEVCAKAAKYTIVEVEEIVETGQLDPHGIHLPSIYVDAVVLGEKYEKRIEQLTTLDNMKEIKFDEKREWMAKRVSKELKKGMYVNLGIGMPTLVANFITDEMEITLHSENGLLGIGPFPKSKKEADPDLINAGKQTVTYRKGACFFDSSESFAMVRGGHIDLTVLGGMQVSKRGDLANWMIPGKMVKGPGGAMDLVTGVKKVIVMMEHVAKNGSFKILEECTLPITGKEVVDMLVTDKGVFTIDENGLTLIEISPFSNLEDIKKNTGCEFRIAENITTN